MKTRYCRICNAPITDSVHAWYCPKHRETAKKEREKRAWKKQQIKRRLKREYPYNKSYGIDDASPRNIRQQNFSSASLRWANMPWEELTEELARYHLSYGQAQIMAYNDTLPEDFGLRKICALSRTASLKAQSSV